MIWFIPVLVFLILWPATALWVSPPLILGANPNSSIAIYQWSQVPGLAWIPAEHMTLIVVFFLLNLTAYVVYRLAREVGGERSIAILAVGFFLMAPLVRARTVYSPEILGLIEVPAFLLFFKDWVQATKIDFAFLRSRAWLILLLLFLSNWTWGPLLVACELAILSAVFFFSESVPPPPGHFGRSTWGRTLVAIAGLSGVGLVQYLLNFLGFAGLFRFPGERQVLGSLTLPASLADWGRPRWQDFFTGEAPLGLNEIWTVKAEALRWVETAAVLPPLQYRAHGLPWGLFGLLGILLLAVIWFARAGRNFDLHPVGMNRAAQLEKQIWGAAVMVLVLILTLAVTPLDRQSQLMHSLDVAILLVLLFAVISLMAWLKLRQTKARTWLILGLLLLAIEFPPGRIQTPVHVLLPPYRSLWIENCGRGMRFPYVTETLGEVDYAHFLERMRGTHCQILNQSSEDVEERNRIEQFGITSPNLDRLFTGDAVWIDQFVQYVKQQKLHWVVFDPRLTTQWQNETCQKLNGTFSEEGVCFPKN